MLIFCVDHLELHLSMSTRSGNQVVPSGGPERIIAGIDVVALARILNILTSEYAEHCSLCGWRYTWYLPSDNKPRRSLRWLKRRAVQFQWPDSGLPQTGGGGALPNSKARFGEEKSTPLRCT